MYGKTQESWPFIMHGLTLTLCPCLWDQQVMPLRVPMADMTVDISYYVYSHIAQYYKSCIPSWV